MDCNSPRAMLARLIAERGENYGALSRLLGRNAAYIQQFMKRGTPRKLDEEDRRTLARYFGVDEALLGGPEEGEATAPLARKSSLSNDMAVVHRLAVEASAGVGTLAEDEIPKGALGFDRRWLSRLGFSPRNLSIIEVNGESMAPTLNHGDTIMVDISDRADRLRDGLYVLRLDDALMVKRVALAPNAGARSITISSDNNHYPTWRDVDPALIDIVGRVVWAARLLA